MSRRCFRFVSYVCREAAGNRCRFDGVAFSRLLAKSNEREFCTLFSGRKNKKIITHPTFRKSVQCDILKRFDGNYIATRESFAYSLSLHISDSRTEAVHRMTPCKAADDNEFVSFYDRNHCALVSYIGGAKGVISRGTRTEIGGFLLCIRNKTAPGSFDLATRTKGCAKSSRFILRQNNNNST